MQNENKSIKMSFPKFWRPAGFGNLPLSKLFTKEEKQPNVIIQVEDPRQKPSGMTPDFMGFTLTELLVVVLIIGILAAVALPQYQKAVEKSKATQALALLKSVIQAQEVYRMSSGEYATSFDELAVDIPWTGTIKALPYVQDTKSNSDWTLQLQNAPGGYVNFFMTRLTGKYKGAGFNYVFTSPTEGVTKNQITCFEKTGDSNILFDTNLPDGSYCVKLFSAVTTGGAHGRYYTLPN